MLIIWALESHKFYNFIDFMILANDFIGYLDLES